MATVPEDDREGKAIVGHPALEAGAFVYYPPLDGVDK